MCYCSKCCTLKTSSRIVSIQVQLNLTLLSISNRTWSRHLSMSTRTQASNLSMPNQWARSINVNRRTQACNLSIPNLWARSQLITICSCITSFGYFRISAVRFTDHVQHNLSRCVQTVFITLVVRKVKSSNTFWVIAKKDGGGD